MQQFALLDELGRLPRPYDGARMARGFERWQEASEACEDAEVGARARAVAQHPAGWSLLACLFGNSPFLSQCALQDLPFACRLAAGPAESLLHELLQAAAAAGGETSERGLMDRLRIAKRRVALLTAVADIAGLWSLSQVTRALSAFAEAALGASVDHLLLRLAAAGEIRLPDAARPAAGSGLAVFGMGKLGARELNYSSDLDLIVLYDQDVVAYTGRRTAQDCFVRLAQSLVKLMQERTAEGYVFRIDLRLRPDPGATPVAISMEAAENYYESLGQNWERAAMIKARCVAGDITAGQGFLDRITPFVWRKHLDYAAIEDIHSIKRQIQAHRGHGAIAVTGHNIKLGRGGIREVEFFAQTQQLIAGGRDRRLRVNTTVGALRAFADSDRLSPMVAAELIDAYEFLRRLEHRLQMIADEQTHTLPEDDAGLAHLACFFGCDDLIDFKAAVRRVLERVQGHYAQLFETAPALDSGRGSLVFTGTEDDPETLRTLSELGYAEPATVAATVRRWHHGRYRAMRSVRARELLTTLMPKLLQALAETAHPDSAFLKFDEFLCKLPAGVQLFSLFYANPSLIDLLAEIMGTAPSLAELLGRNPILLDAVLIGEFYEPLPDAERLAAELDETLQAAKDFQDALDLSRRWVGDRKFQVGVQVLRNICDIETSGRALSALADAALRAFMPRVEEEFARQHGRIEGGGMALIGMGKLGGREMTFGSDLDIIFVYDHAPDVDRSDGPRPLPPSQYYARLCQRIISGLTALTPEGRLYDVDMRLRPSGNAGPIAVRLDGFEQYQREQAWTWEHMALTRARVVAGPPVLRQRIADAICLALGRPRDPERLVQDVAEMRRRIDVERAISDPWAIKYVRGGLIDLEFIAQALVLQHAQHHQDLIDGNTASVFRRLGAAGLLPAAEASGLAEATLLQRSVQGLLRLCYSGAFDEQTAPPGLRALLARAGGSSDLAALKEKLVSTQDMVRRRFAARIEEPAAAAGPAAATSDLHD